MRHQKKKKGLDRNKTQREALMRSQVISLTNHGHITTTTAKAKYLKTVIEKLITIAKKNTLTSRRAIYSNLANKKASDKLIKISEKFKEQKGGYTRLTKVGFRKGDSAALTQIEIL